MARQGVPGVVSVGNRREFPREAWGWQDWQDEERLQDQLGKEPGTSVVIPPPGPQLSPGFSLFPRSNRRETASATSRGVDALLEKHGIGRRVAKRSAPPAKSSPSAVGRRVDDSAKPRRIVRHLDGEVLRIR